MQILDVNPRVAKEDSGLLSRPELEQMISWETNNLYEYLKELYDHKHEEMLDDRYTVKRLLAVSLCLVPYVLYSDMCCCCLFNF